MTREEASIIIGNIPINGDGCYSISEYQQAKARAIEALEQKLCEDVVKKDCDKCAYYDNGANDEACDGCFADEYEHPNFKPKAQPCEDCISRQAVDELSKELVHTTRDKADFLCNFWEGLQKLPPVTPKEKTRKGEWLRMSDLSEQEDDRYKCSHCGNVVHYRNKMNLYTFNSWCGRCGSDNGRKIEVEL